MQISWRRCDLRPQVYHQRTFKPGKVVRIMKSFRKEFLLLGNLKKPPKLKKRKLLRKKSSGFRKRRGKKI